jgi:maltodextrin utilization protein YvdJ
MSNQFPLNYFSSIFPFYKTVKNKDNLKIYQIIIIFIFLNSLVLVPLMLSVLTVPPDEYFKIFPTLNNTPNIYLTIFGMLTVLCLSLFLLLSLGVAFFIYLTKFSGFGVANTYKEAFTITLNLYGVPCFVAFIVGLIVKNSSVILTLQNVLFVIITLFVMSQYIFKQFKLQNKLLKKERI